LRHSTPNRPALLSPWRLPGWEHLRLLVASLALAVALASFMHVAHSHGSDGSGVSKLCSFCASFDRGTAPPPAAPPPPRVDGPIELEPAAAATAAPSPVRATFRPRAPPHSLG
jgi:hypothetical protein